MTSNSERTSRATTPRAQSPAIERRELTFLTEIPRPVPASSHYPKPPQPVTDPLDWTRSKKALTTLLCCVLTAVGGYATGSANATIPQQGALWGLDETTLLLGTTTYALAFALSPMFLAPFSEIRGRKPVFLGSGFLLALSSMGCGLADSFAGFLVARFFAGMGSSTFSTMCGGIVTDMYNNEDRGAPMAIFAASAFFGTGLGPLISDVIVFHIDWRWDYYVQAIALAALSILSIFLLSESRQNVLLVIQAEKLNQWQRICHDKGTEGLQLTSESMNTVPNTKDVEKGGLTPSRSSSDARICHISWYVRGEEEKPTLLQSVRISLTRPFHLLVTEPIVFWLAMWTAFAWSVFYLALAGITITFDAAYPFNQEQTGAVYAAIPAAAVLGGVMHVTQDRLFPNKPQHDTEAPSSPSEPSSTWSGPTPESRLRFATWESLLFPAGLFWWAWTCRAGVPWIVPAMGVACTFMGVYTIFLCVLNYTADSYHRLASSALAAQSLTRNVLGALFPLASAPMFRALGTDGALSMLAGVALLLSAVPAVLLAYGPGIRARSRIASEIMREGRRQ